MSPCSHRVTRCGPDLCRGRLKDRATRAGWLRSEVIFAPIYRLHVANYIRHLLINGKHHAFGKYLFWIFHFFFIAVTYTWRRNFAPSAWDYKKAVRVATGRAIYSYERASLGYERQGAWQLTIMATVLTGSRSRAPAATALDGSDSDSASQGAPEKGPLTSVTAVDVPALGAPREEKRFWFQRTGKFDFDAIATQVCMAPPYVQPPLIMLTLTAERVRRPRFGQRVSATCRLVGSMPI
jgi:hypothetical protein